MTGSRQFVIGDPEIDEFPDTIGVGATTVDEAQLVTVPTVTVASMVEVNGML